MGNNILNKTGYVQMYFGTRGERIYRWERKPLTLETNAITLKTRVRYALRLIGTVTVRIAFFAGLNGFQVDQVNEEYDREISSNTLVRERPGCLLHDRCNREYRVDDTIP